MNRFTAHTIATAPTASRPSLEGLERSFGFVPNLFGVIAESPAALQGALAAYQAFTSSSLTPAEQQLVLVAVSEANDCEFCVAAHSTIAKRIAKVDPELVAATRNRVPLNDPKLDALVTFTRKLVEQRGLVPDSEVAAFLAAGYTRAQVIEVLLGVGLKTFNNYVVHVAHPALNDQFKAEAWRPNRKVS